MSQKTPMVKIPTMSQTLTQVTIHLTPINNEKVVFKSVYYIIKLKKIVNTNSMLSISL